MLVFGAEELLNQLSHIDEDYIRWVRTPEEAEDMADSAVYAEKLIVCVYQRFKAGSDFRFRRPPYLVIFSEKTPTYYEA